MIMDICDNCVKCCMDTEMPLSEGDIARIRKLGFTDFTIERDGWLQLRNSGGRCVFNGGSRCKIYADRPEGCRFYPVIYDEEKGEAVLDGDCPRRESFNVSDVDLKGLRELVARLRKERKARMKNRLNVRI